MIVSAISEKSLICGHYPWTIRTRCIAATLYESGRELLIASETLTRVGIEYGKKERLNTKVAAACSLLFGYRGLVNDGHRFEPAKNLIF